MAKEAFKATLDLKVLLEQLAHKAFKAILVHKDLLGLQDPFVHLDLKLV
jgi:hypothetical protein